MPYLGKPAGARFQNTVKDSFSGDGSTTAFTMSQTVHLVTDIEVFADNVQQEPTIAFTISGTTLTFTEAPDNGTNNIYVIHRGGGHDSVTIQKGSSPTLENLIIADAGTIGSTSSTSAITIASTGAVTFVGAANASGIVALSDTTEASATGTAALTVAGGIGVAKDMWIGDDIVMDSDSAVLKMGADQDVTITHVADTGITLNDMDIDGVASVNAGQIGGSRNFIYNGDMQIAQRSTSVGSLGNGGASYDVADRWQIWATVDNLVLTMSQSTTTPDGFNSSLKLLAGTSSGSLAVDDQFYIAQIFEGYDLQSWNKGDAQAKSVTLSFWVNATQTGTYILRFSAGARHICQAYTVSSADTWEYKTLTFPGDTTGAFANSAATALYVQWALVAGTNYTSGTLATSWAGDSAVNRFVGQVDAFDDDDDMFHLTGVQLELGSTATAFQYEKQNENLLRCSRYYAQRAAADSILYGSSSSGTGSNYSHWQFHVPMRAAPTMTGHGGGSSGNTQQQINVDSGGTYAAAGTYATWGNDSTASAELS